jgi:hypothetical protein
MQKKFYRLFAVAVILISILSVAYAAYLVGTLTGTVSVLEPISWSPETLTWSKVYAGENDTATPVTILNAANVPLTVDVAVTTNCTSSWEFTAGCCNGTSMSVPAAGSYIIVIWGKVASNATASTNWSCTVLISRE